MNASNAASRATAPSEDESRSRILWKTFHRTVAIENRRNTRLQRQFMPARYWTHLTEMDNAPLAR